MVTVTKTSKRIAVTLGAAALLLVIALPFVDLFAVDVFLVLFVPVVVLVLAQVRPILHWILFVLVVAATGFVLVYIAHSDSSTAGFGLLSVPLLLCCAVLLAAVVDRRVGRADALPRSQRS